MIVYIDKEYKCHANQEEGYAAVETAFFDGKCKAYIEGYRFVPSGETWVRDDGVEFHGEMVSPWKSYDELDAAQREYEKQLLAELQANSIAIAELEAAYQEGVDSV